MRVTRNFSDIETSGNYKLYHIVYKLHKLGDYFKRYCTLMNIVSVINIQPDKSLQRCLKRAPGRGSSLIL